MLRHLLNICPVSDICCLTIVRPVKPVQGSTYLPDNQHLGEPLSESIATDRRSVRSRRMLWEALLALLQNEDWAEISVQMICDRADVARSTFYAHYQTKQDLLEAGFALGAAEISRQIAAMPATSDRMHTLDWLVDHIGASQGFHRRVQGSPAGQTILNRFRAMTTELLRKDLQRLNMRVGDAELVFIAGGVFAAIEAWIAQGCRESTAALIGRLRATIERVIE